MQKLQGHQLIAYAVLIFIGIAFILAVYKIATQPDMPLGDHLAQSYPVKRAGNTPIFRSDNVILLLNKAEKVAGLQIVYLGIAEGRLNLGIRIPQLDPDYTYMHNIPLKQARQGFSLVGHSFTLLSAGDNYLRLKVNRGPSG